jgi:hypothetical protein
MHDAADDAPIVRPLGVIFSLVVERDQSRAGG